MDKEIRKVDDIRDDISKIDYQIAELFEKRMGFAAELALSKSRRANPFIIKIKKTKSCLILQRTVLTHLS
ncbi:MAG: hypothetical protein ACLVIY_02960 [Anaerobutyricum soehngenii]